MRDGIETFKNETAVNIQPVNGLFLFIHIVSATTEISWYFKKTKLKIIFFKNSIKDFTGWPESSSTHLIPS